MITQEDIPYTKEEYEAMVKTIERLRKEKKEIIDKAREWIKNHYTDYIRFANGMHYFSYTFFDEDFNKAMNENG